MKNLSIRAKLLLGVAAGLLVTASLSVAVVRQITERSLRTSSEQALRTARAVYENLERGDVEKLSTALDAIATRADLQEAWLARDREKLHQLAAPLFAKLKEQHGITHWYFLDLPPGKECFLRVHAKQKFGDPVGRETLALSIESGAVGAGKELGKTAFALRVVKPVVVEGKPIGYLELGEEIDHFLGRMKEQTGDEFTMVIAKKHLDQKAWAEARGEANGWDARPADVVVDATDKTAAVPPLADVEAVPDEGRLLGEVTRGEKLFTSAVFPVLDAGGRKVGALILQHDTTEMHASVAAGRLQLVLLILGLGLAVALFVLALLEKLVFRRLTHMMATMEDLSVRLAGGDYDVAGAFPPPDGDDEIGKFERFFGEFLSLVANTFRMLTRRDTGT